MTQGASCVCTFQQHKEGRKIKNQVTCPKAHSHDGTKLEFKYQHFYWSSPILWKCLWKLQMPENMIPEDGFPAHEVYWGCRSDVLSKKYPLPSASYSLFCPVVARILTAGTRQLSHHWFIESCLWEVSKFGHCWGTWPCYFIADMVLQWLMFSSWPLRNQMLQSFFQL